MVNNDNTVVTAIEADKGVDGAIVLGGEEERDWRQLEGPRIATLRRTIPAAAQ